MQHPSLVISLILISSLFHHALAICEPFGFLLSCYKTLPNSKDIFPEGSDLMIQRLRLKNFTADYLSFDGYPLTVAPNAQIKRIELNDGVIRGIEDGYFARISGPDALEELALNQVEGEFTVTRNTFQGIGPKLKKLKLHTSLRMKSDSFNDFQALEEIDFRIKSYFEFKKILRILVTNNVNLTKIVLEHNRIERLPWRELLIWAEKCPKQGCSLSLYGNLLTCDSSLVELRKYMSKYEQK
ncbi:hypothetical protein Ciccas_002912 [Cichlidogyrus casuarinus]|uniref:Uncharacterized protein n=1 Tax=Cichlidogyrus casuarinus TaxID=1844966 RepID=A0ABD2QFW3_9PLAT